MTSATQTFFAEEYSVALRDYLREPKEAALSHAYDLGRKALDSGMGVLDLATIHNNAVSLASLPSATTPEQLTSAAMFFSESLAPFEMTLRGYMEANWRLQVLNQTLATRNAELQSAKSAADAANQELEAFSYSVAHDLRAPLRHIDGFSKMLLEKSAHLLDEGGRGNLQRVRSAVARMAELIDDLLRLSRVASSELQRQRVDLSALAQTVATELARNYPEHLVHCAIQDDLVAEGDPALLRVVFENLLGNAWKFTGKTEKPFVEVGRFVNKEAQSTFFVRDNGAGFDPEYAGRLFAPFQRLHRQSDFPGNGVGLATVQRIVRRHGGRIWAESAVTHGATFFWTLSS